MRLKFYCGKWDSWGFGVSFCQYDRCFGIEFIHWYGLIQLWTKKEVKEYEQRVSVIYEHLRADEQG